MATVGSRIKEARVSKGLTQQQLADELGWAGQNRISNYEKGREPSLADLKLIAAALDKRG